MEKIPVEFKILFSEDVSYFITKISMDKQADKQSNKMYRSWKSLKVKAK